MTRNEDVILAKGHPVKTEDVQYLRDVLARLSADVALYGAAGDDAFRIQRIRAFLAPT